MLTDEQRIRKNKANREYYYRNHAARKEKARESSKKFYKTNSIEKLKKQTQRRKDNPEHTLWQSAKNNSTNRGIPFEIEVSDIIIPDICPALGIKLVVGGDKWENSPSIDRLVPYLGYVKGNINVISLRANRIKFDATLWELESIVAFIKTMRLKDI